MVIRATVVLEKKQIEELVYSLKNDERVQLILDFELNGVKNQANQFFEDPKEVWEKLKSIADQSKSYNDFVENVLDWLDLGRHRDYYRSAIFCAEKAQKVTWDGIELLMLGERISFSVNDKVYVSKKISRKMRNVVNSTDIIKKVILYKNYNF